MTREQRLRERETAKVLKEEELRKLKENEQKLATNAARLSERHLKAMMKQHESDLKRLNEEEDWFFDCEKCGTYGSNLVSLLYFLALMPLLTTLERQHPTDFV
jgi:hypothetical protein